MHKLAKLVSYVLHPLFCIFYALLLLMCVNPYLFSIQEPKHKAIIVLYIFLLSVMFPLLTMSLMRSVGLIKSLKMETKTQRIVPLIAVGIFYLWLYVNMKNNTLIPEAFATFVLGANIALFMAFFINNFYKISLHTTGMGGILGIILFIRFYYSFDSFYVNWGNWGIYVIDLNILVLMAIISAGLVGTSRLLLAAHNKMEVYSGYVVGLAGQLIAFRIMFVF